MNKYCGPAVLSILTGRNTDECARIIRSINGQYEVAGVQLDDLLRAADKLGFDQRKIEVGGSLYRSLLSLSNRNGLYVITVPHHFVVIEVNNKEIFFCDNHTKEPMRAAASARLMQPCLACYRVERRKDYVEPEPLRLISSCIVINITEGYGGTKSIEVMRNKKFNYPENNRTITLGIISGLTNDELKEVIFQLDLIHNKEK